MPLPTLAGQGSIGGGSAASPPSQRPRRPPNGPGPGAPGAPAQQGQGAPQPQQTFAQLQQQGLARPAPTAAPPPQQVGQYAPSDQHQQFTNQLQGAVSNALTTPSRYDLPQVQQVRDSLTQQLQTQFGAQKKQIDEEMARRGLSASTIGGGYYGDLASNQANAMANLNAQLIQNAAATHQGDLSASLGAGQSFQSAMANQGLAGYGANLQGTSANNASNMAEAQFNQGQYNNATQLALGAGQASGQLGLGQQSQDLARQLGYGNLGISQQQANTQQAGTMGQLGLQAGELTGNYGGQQTLGAKAQGEQSRQFDVQQQLAQLLGLGNLGVSQQQANTQSAAQQAQQSQFGQSLAEQQAARGQQQSQFGAQLGESGRQFDLQQQLQQLLGLGNLGVSQQQANTQQAGTLGQLGLGQQQLQQQGSQFDKSQQEGSRQFDLQQALQSALGMGNLGVQQGQLGVQQQQADIDAKYKAGTLSLQDRNQQLAELQNTQQFGMAQQQFGEGKRQFDLQQALQSALGLGNLGVQQQQANTGAAAQQSQAAYQTGQLGLGQQSQDLAKQLGLGQLGVSQQQANTQTAEQQANAAYQSGQLGLGGRNAALAELAQQQGNALQAGQLTGTYNGQQTLGAVEHRDALAQFAASLGQQNALAKMSDQTANRGLDIQRDTNSNALNMQLAQLLAAMGYNPTNQLPHTPTTPTTPPTNNGGPPDPVHPLQPHDPPTGGNPPDTPLTSNVPLSGSGNGVGTGSGGLGTGLSGGGGGGGGLHSTVPSQPDVGVGAQAPVTPPSPMMPPSPAQPAQPAQLGSPPAPAADDYMARILAALNGKRGFMSP